MARPTMRRALASALLVLSAVASSALAQQFVEPAKKHFPRGAFFWTRCVAAGDVDGDGDVDVFFGNGGYSDRLYLNSGGGRFALAPAGQLPRNQDAAMAALFADVDGDGDLDLVTGNGYGYASATWQLQERLYLNDGAGAFTDVTSTHMPGPVGHTHGLAAGDVDGDGDIDLVLANSGYGEQNNLYLNDGQGRFSDATASHLPAAAEYTRAVALGDVDGDGDLDLVSANFGWSSGQSNTLYLNDGLGRFRDVTASRFPANGDYTEAVALGDADGDGDLDVVFGNSSGQDRLYFNDSRGTFTDVTASRLPAEAASTHAVVLLDVDADGDLDLATAHHFTVRGRHNGLYLNTGEGFFRSACAQLPPDRDATYGLAAADVDGDGDPDLFAANDPPFFHNRLYLNDGRGVFASGNAVQLPRTPLSPANAALLIDVDADGHPDLVSANEVTNRLHRNDGRGHFVDVTGAKMPAISEPTEAVAAGDLDGDGDVDLVFGNRGQNRVYMNDAAGAFQDETASRLPPNQDTTMAVAIGDVDGDGDPDLVFGNDGVLGGQNTLYLNHGRGFFTDATVRLPAVIGRTRFVALADVDGDGDLDLFSGPGPRNTLYLNDGSGRYVDVTATHLPTVRGTVYTAVFADVDADGDPDLVFASAGTHALYVNDGRGVFQDVSAARMPAGARGSAVFAGDLDEDGDLDLILGIRFYANDGNGFFSDVTFPGGALSLRRDRCLAMGDVDEDGDLDLVFRSDQTLLVNLHRHVVAPWIPMRSTTYTLELHGRPGYGGPLQIALPLLAPAAKRTPLGPLGVLGLDPHGMVALPAVGLPPPGGAASVHIAVPRAPSLVGRTIYSQALILDPSAPVQHFTNVVADRIF